MVNITNWSLANASPLHNSTPAEVEDCLAVRLKNALGGVALDATSPPAATQWVLSALFVGGVFISLFGARAFLPSFAVGGFGIGFAAGLAALSSSAVDACEGGIVIALLAGGFAASIAVCAAKAALPIVGAASVGILAYEAMEATLSEWPPSSAYFLGKPWEYFVGLGAACLVGGCFASLHRRLLLIAGTSLVGGWAVASASTGIAASNSVPFPAWAESLLFVGVAGVGAAFQYRGGFRLTCRRKGGEGGGRGEREGRERKGRRGRDEEEEWGEWRNALRGK